jgi:hypothetical protein
MATKLMQIGDLRRPELGAIGLYRTKRTFEYDKNHPYVKSDGGITNGDKHGKDPININDRFSYTKVGDLNDIKARIGNILDSPGTITQNKYQRGPANEYDLGDVAYP